VSGFPSNSPKVTVVSKVFGRQFSNNHAISGSAIFGANDSIAPSTARLRNRLADEAGRFDGYCDGYCDGAVELGEPSKKLPPGKPLPATAKENLRSASRREKLLNPVILFSLPNRKNSRREKQAASFAPGKNRFPADSSATSSDRFRCRHHQ